MLDVVISVENLSKRYLVGHKTAQAEHRPDFREIISRNVNSFARKTRDILSGRPIVQGDEVEEFWALKDVSFEVRQGERLGIIGRNGAGKSTLLKILSRITEPTKGRVRITGRVASLLEVGTGFHPELSGRENIYLNGAMLGMRRAEVHRKFDEIVDFAEVEKFLDTPVKHYSSGMYVRLAFAVAAHLEPEILIVDEVLAVGDAMFQKKCLGKLGQFGSEGKTVLFVSHNLSAIRKMCDSAIWLDAGMKKIQAGVTHVVSMYLDSTHNAESEQFQTLVAPKADITNICLRDSNGNILETIDTDTEINFHITYSIKISGRINMVLNLSKDDCFAFQSINNHDPHYLQKKDIGTYCSVCILPAHFLNNGNYILSLTVFEENYANPTDFRDVMVFSVSDGPSIRGDYFGGLLGCTRPLLLWTTRKVEQVEIP